MDLRGVTVIAMDKFAIQKGHRYATVIVEPSSKRVLWVKYGGRSSTECKWTRRTGCAATAWLAR